MKEEDIRALIVAELGNIAPESDAAGIDPNADLRDALDIDSLDFLNFLAALHKKAGVNVPEADYAKLLTLNRAIAYLATKLR
jgi:acyl carrier protein